MASTRAPIAAGTAVVIAAVAAVAAAATAVVGTTMAGILRTLAEDIKGGRGIEKSGSTKRGEPRRMRGGRGDGGGLGAAVAAAEAAVLVVARIRGGGKKAVGRTRGKRRTTMRSWRLRCHADGCW